MTTTAAMQTGKAPTFDQTKLKDSYCVQGTNHLGAWNSDFLLFTDIGQPQYRDDEKLKDQDLKDQDDPKTIKPNMIAYKTPTELWVVDSINDVYQWKQPSEPSKANGWTKLDMLKKVKMVAFDPSAGHQLTAVSMDGKVVQWKTTDYTSNWEELNPGDDWDLLMVAFDPKSGMWCVAEDSNAGGTRIGQWNKDYKRWASLGELGELKNDQKNRVVTMIGFDASSTLWGVYDSAANNAPAPKDSSTGKPAPAETSPSGAKNRYGDKIAYWDATGESWVDPKMLTLPKIQWLTWKPAGA
jgi:hypothetical protein